MGLEAVKEEILSSAKEQANSLIAEARKEANKIMREAEKKIEEMKEKSDIETKKMIDTIKRQELASAELENKKMLLEAKKDIIETVFAEVKKRLEMLDDKKRESYMKKLLDKARKELEVAFVYCNKKDAKFVKGFTAEPTDIAGGLIAENKDRTIRLNYSFETMLESIRDSELQSINKLLFG